VSPVRAYHTRVSDSSVRRLSEYHRILEDLEGAGTELVSSARLAALAGTNPAQIRKDLSYFGTFGKRGSGYRVSDLRSRILEILGLHRRWRVAVVGAGNLGRALFAHREFTRYGFDIVAIFETDPEKIGRRLDGISITHIDNCTEVIRDLGVELCIVATPAPAAQSVTEKLVEAGVKGLLNFAPRQVETVRGVELRNVNLTVELEGLTFALQAANRRRESGHGTGRR
jgi:redox-sensing transcriptional repressor